MGRRTERARSYWAQTAATATQQRAMEDTQSREQQLRSMEQYLGTDEQIAGDLGGDARLAQYTERYEFDMGTLQSLMTGHKRGFDAMPLLQQNMAKANEIMDQAEAAARAGDFSTASRLRSEALSGITAVGAQVQRGDVFKSAIKTVRDEDAMARGSLSNPMAQAVGSMVRDAREFQDWESQTSKDFRGRLTESSERSIAAGARSAMRQARDFGLSRGAARNPFGAQAVAASTARGFAAERAQVQSQAAQFFETYRRQYARDTAQFAQEWMQNAAGLRTEFSSQMQGMSSNLLASYTNQAQLGVAHGAASAQAQQASRDRSMQAAKMIGSIALGAVTGGIGAMGGGLGAVLGGAAQGGAAGAGIQLPNY